MRKIGRHCLTSLLISMVALANSGASVQAEPRASAPTLIVRVLEKVDIPNPVMSAAIEQVDRIYRNAGIEIVWLKEDSSEGASQAAAVAPGSPGLNGLLLTLILAAESSARKMVGRKTVTGLALSMRGEGSRRAYVFPDRVNSLAVQYRNLSQPAARGLLLGHVIAHEVGHLMLPPGHARSGIMRGALDRDCLSDALDGALLFTPEQGELIRAAMLRQTEQ